MWLFKFKFSYLDTAANSAYWIRSGSCRVILWLLLCRVEVQWFWFSWMKRSCWESFSHSRGKFYLGFILPWPGQLQSWFLPLEMPPWTLEWFVAMAAKVTLLLLLRAVCICDESHNVAIVFSVQKWKISPGWGSVSSWAQQGSLSSPSVRSRS